MLAAEFTYYLPDASLREVSRVAGVSLEDVLSHDQEKVWNNPAFHDRMLEQIKKTPFDSRFLSGKLFDVWKTPDPQTLKELFKPRAVQPAVQTRLTKEEKKKQAREKRREYQKELQEKIKYGLVPPPPPKVKLSNFMRVLANEAAQDPTKVEQEVRKLVEENQKKHIERNEARKPTAEQKKEKMLKKLKKDSAKECRVAVFVVRVGSADPVNEGLQDQSQGPEERRGARAQRLLSRARPRPG